MSIEKLESLLGRVQRNRRKASSSSSNVAVAAAPAVAQPRKATSSVSVAPAVSIQEVDEDRPTSRPAPVADAPVVAVPPQSKAPALNPVSLTLDSVSPMANTAPSPTPPTSARPAPREVPAVQAVPQVAAAPTTSTRPVKAAPTPTQGQRIKPDSIAPPSAAIASASSSVQTSGPSDFGTLLTRTLSLRLK